MLLEKHICDFNRKVERTRASPAGRAARYFLSAERWPAFAGSVGGRARRRASTAGAGHLF